ncbi:hypothetical protein F444_02984 [Phytophthora nicotianae P1976]|uniref:Uncharacterized protein n=1 Tax=Phytophthora nicotianae P1976 TaxID=1317066 RepID=A0A081AVL9_PHYNI|nr:hypothetical protein F444_02984 [Phytophthora nicotianae P1976]
MSGATSQTPQHVVVENKDPIRYDRGAFETRASRAR